MEVQLGNRKVSRKNPPVKNLVTAVQRLVLLVPADEEEQGPAEALEPQGEPNQGLANAHYLSKPRGRPQQKGLAEDHLPAHVGSLAPILGEGQEQKKEEVLPGFSSCRPSGRVADPGPMPKVSHHSCLDPKTLPPPSLKSCHPMCGPTPEPKLTPNLGPAANPDVPVHPQQVGVAEVVPGQDQNLPGPSTSRSRVRLEQKGLADGSWQSWLRQVASFFQA